MLTVKISEFRAALGTMKDTIPHQWCQAEQDRAHGLIWLARRRIRVVRDLAILRSDKLDQMIQNHRLQEVVRFEDDEKEAPPKSPIG